MAAKRREIHSEAFQEFKVAIAWYRDRGEKAAENFVAEVDRAVELPLGSPQRWPVFDFPARRFVLRRFLRPYLA
jgi:hypothetical protein